jgi:hypothetical protein
VLLISRAPRPVLHALRRVAAVAGAVVAVIVLAGGCGLPGIGSGSAGAGVSASALSFHFQRITGDGMMDQELSITNSSGQPVVPTLQFTPLDELGEPVAGVTVTSAYGSDRGQLVVGAKGFIDVLAFHGTDSLQVRDVHVDVTSVTLAKRIVVTHDLTTTFLDASGDTVDRFGDFDKVVLTNPNDIDATVRIVYIVWDQPAEENGSQQAVSVTPIGGVIVIPHRGKATVQVDGDAAAAVARYGDGSNAVSVKVFPSQ